MNKSLLPILLIPLLSTSLYAENTTSVTSPSTPPTTATTTTTPASTKPTGGNLPAIQEGTVMPSSTTPASIDCNYHTPATTSLTDQTLITKWAEKATEQSFNFDYNTIDAQLTTLKACFTEQGWQGFNDALQKSGNLNAIKSQQLMVSSMLTGETTVALIRENQWKVTLPLQVVYQNTKEKLTQSLLINLIVGRKPSGDLGIIQLIAAPANPSMPDNASTTSTTTTTTTSSSSSQPTTPASSTPQSTGAQ